jgi:N12 class adenine-specific DNA methylase
VLARWSGWGAVPQVFDEHLDAYAAERAELRELLTDEEYAAARRSTLNAHYTDAALVSVIWDGLHQLGFTGGRVLEPGCGSGHFIGLAPEEAHLTGVEREPISAAIATALYPHARIVSGSFTDLDAAESAFDAVIGNVPFAKIALNDPRHNTGRHSIHNHFIIKALHLTRPGGMVAVLTSRYTLDAVNPGARTEMAELADLVGALRLPTGAHRRAAGTDAVTDLLILRRREPDAIPRVDFGGIWEKSLPTAVGPDGALIEINTYFRDHPEHVLGELALAAGMYGSENLRIVSDLDTVAARFAAAVQQITAEASERGLTLGPPTGRGHSPRAAAEAQIIDPGAARFAGFLTARADGTFTRRVDGQDVPYVPPVKQAGELRMLLGLRDAAMSLINTERRSIGDTPEIGELRVRLNERYDAYLAAHGPINRCSERRQLRPAWHVFSGWCERHDRQRLPASPDVVHDYLSDLRHHGLGRDLLRRHLDAIADAHATAHNRQLAKAIARYTSRSSADEREQREELARRLAKTNPKGLLSSTSMDDLRLPPESLAAGEQVLVDAPATTDPDLDLDALGLRTTVVLRPPQGGFRSDPFSNVVRALERFDVVTQTARKADIFSRRVIHPPRTRLGADTPEEALSICLDTHSRVDLPEIARLLGLPDPQQARAALGELVYDDPDTGEPIWARQYLAGNVRQKLARAKLAAEQDQRFAANVAALERVVPPDLGPEDIEIRLGSWIGPTYVQQFLRELLDDPTARVEHVAGLWRATGDGRSVAATELWGGGGLNAFQLTERLLVGSEIRVMHTVETVDASGQPVEREVFDAQATEEARDKARELGDRFADWVWEDTDRAQDLIKQYNDLFNAEIPPDFSGVELSLPGLSLAFKLRQHQQTAVARIIYQPATGLVHEVGAGKTLEMIVGVMERRRRGLAHKPAVVVPNDSIAEQFEREWLQAYPSARLLTATSADLAGKKGGRDQRAEFVARVATGDWDAVIMTKEAFQRIPLHPEAQEQFLSAELEALEEAKRANQGGISESMTKRLETAIQQATERLKARLADIDRDTVGVTFRDTGIDFLVVDEAQHYKNGMVPSSLPGLAIEGADRSIDLDMKLAWLAETHGSSRVVLATATPFTNTFSEIYLWLRRLGHRLPAFDIWARTHCTSETFMEMTPGGALRAKTRMRRVINEPELWRSLRLTSDIKMKEDLNLPTPRLRGDQVEIITAPAPVEARIFTLDLARRERQLRGRAERGADNHLVIQHDGQLVALDVRTVGLHTDQHQKVDILADDIHTEWATARANMYYRDDGSEHPTRGGLILVFCDESTPGKGWNFYTELRQQLVARGMDERTIRFIHEASSPQRKADLLAACREGAVSVLVGSTMKMGAGINVQTRAIGGYEITGPWRPDIPAQARGRVERQGNQNPEFFWKRVVTSPSMDAKKWEITHQKHGMFAPLYAGTPPSRTREVHDDQSVGLADVMAAATGDPRYREKAELDQEYKALQRQRSAHMRTQQSLKLLVTSLGERIPSLEAKAERQDAIAARRTDTRSDRFSMTIKGRVYTKRADAAEALKELLLAALAAAPRTPQGETIAVGQLGGYDLSATLFPLREMSILLNFPDAAENATGMALDHRVLPKGHGIITRLEHQLDVIATAGDRTRELIDQEQRNLDHARSGVGKAFPHEQRLIEVTLRRAELISELSVDAESEADANLDPDSAEAKARAARAEARQRERQELSDAAHDMAMQLSANTRAATVFAGWFAEITAPVAPDQRPPADAAFAVWQDLGGPAAYSDGKAPPRATAAAASASPISLPTTIKLSGQSAITATPSSAIPDVRDADQSAGVAGPNGAGASDEAGPAQAAEAAPPSKPPGPVDAARPADDDGGTPAGPTTSDGDPAPEPAATPSTGTAGLVVEHNHSGTLVRGTSQQDRQLHQILRDNGFKFSRRLDAWYLGRQQRYDTRSFRVRRLCAALEQAGRAFELCRQETMASADSTPAPMPTGEAFSSRAELVAAARAALRPFGELRRIDAASRMMSSYQGRPDGQALNEAGLAVVTESLRGDPKQLLDRYERLYRAATALRTNLAAEGKRAPVLMSRLDDLITHTGTLVGRLSATLAQGSTLHLDRDEQHRQAPAVVEAPPQSPPTPTSLDERIERYARINASAARWFEAELEGSDAQHYLSSRLIDPETLRRLRERGFCIGYAPANWTRLIGFLQAGGHRDEDIVAAGLATPDRRGRLTDRFRNRIMFGIRDLDGRIAGFIGRTLSPDGTPKYLNTPTTPLFDKGRLLFGLHEQRDAHGADPVFVEGPFDVLAIAALDDPRVLPVGTCGTALTAKHLDAVDTLIPPTRRRVLALDGDPAGQQAALATAADALSRYPTLDITTLPDGLDPADWAHAVPAEQQLAPYLGAPHCRPALDVLVDARLATWEDRLRWAEGRVGAARDVARLLAVAEPRRANELAVNLSSRLSIDPVHMAEYIAAERHRLGQAVVLPALTTELHPEPEADSTVEFPAAGDMAPEPTPITDSTPEPDKDGQEPDDPYAREAWRFIDGLTGVSERFRAQHWSLVEERAVEVGGVYAEHWRRHSTSIAINITPDQRVLSTLLIKHDPKNSTNWDELEITSAQAVHELIEQAGLHGVARPARLPGLWRVASTNSAADAAHAADESPDARLVVRPADAADPAWFFADDGAPVPLAPPLPDILVTNRDDLVNYILGDHARDKDIHALVQIVLSGRSRQGIHRGQALRRLAGHDQELYRRALMASVGQPNRGQPFDVSRARLALERLAEGDPALPLNSVDSYVELTELDPTADLIRLRRPAPTRSVRGVVTGVKPAPPNRITVIIERDIPCITGAERACQDFALDASVPLLDPATRPSAEEREAAAAAMRPAIEERRASLGIPAPTSLEDDGAPAEPAWPIDDPDADVSHKADPLPAASDQPLTEVTAPLLNAADSGGPGSEIQDAPAPAPSAELPAVEDDVARHWTSLLAKAAEHGFSVRTNYDGASSIDTGAATIAVASNQPPFDRVVELAQLVGAAAIWRAGVETITQPEPTHTPIYDALCRELNAQPNQITPTASQYVVTPTRITLNRPGVSGDLWG